MSELAERAYFSLCLALGRLLRSGKYSSTLIVHADGELQVRKRRLSYAPFLVWMGGPLLRILDTGVRVLPQRHWEARERQLYRSLHGSSIQVEGDGTLLLPCLAGETLAALLENAEMEASIRKKAIQLAVVALGELHGRGFTHGDAMAENVMIDLEAGIAHWFDFETLHDSSRPIAWRRADDVRALLVTCLLRTPPDQLAGTLELIIGLYADEEVTGLLATRFTSVLQRALTLHLGQAPLSFRYFGEIARLLKERSPSIRKPSMTQPSGDFLEFQAALAGEYSLQRELGRGGMGIVYLARDVQLDRDVAIKVLPPRLAETTASRERFVREARTAAGLSHPHIVPIHRVGEAGGFVFFVMSYVEGETLGERLRTRGPLSPADAMRVLREVAWALAYAHGRGIVHRDVKPDNILLEAGTGRALVTDFGIAHGGANPDAATDPGKIMGTVNFMSPEQAAGEPVDGRSDIYALGVVGYLAVSGRLPFEAANLPALLDRQATEAPPSVSRAAPGLPPALAAAIDRCLDRDPEGRFPDGEAMATALAPSSDARPALPPTLRAWLGARNPLLVPYMGWSAGFTALTLGNIFAWLTGNPGSGPGDVALLLAATSSPLVPIVGFHLNQARRQFRAGHTLTDLRSALEVERRERAESEALAREDEETLSHRLLRLATVGSATWLSVTFGLVLQGTIHENQVGVGWIIMPILSTMLLGAVSNALDVQFIPTRIREWWQTGIRDRLWNSHAGEWLARRLGAPERSRAVGGGMFRATEAALGVAAGELFAALPEAYRDQLAELPATVAALEARAAEARAEIDLVAALAPSGSGDADVLAARRNAAAARLADSVAALEGVRLDLLRLHAGAGDLPPLTTLIDAARLLGEHASRLADAQREVDAAMATPSPPSAPRSAQR